MDFFQPDRRHFEGQHSHFEQCLSGSISQRSGIGTQSLAPSFGRGVQHQIGSLVYVEFGGFNRENRKIEAWVITVDGMHLFLSGVLSETCGKIEDNNDPKVS